MGLHSMPKIAHNRRQEDRGEGGGEREMQAQDGDKSTQSRKKRTFGNNEVVALALGVNVANAAQEKARACVLCRKEERGWLEVKIRREAGGRRERVL
jgi:hypothetical protein